MKNILLAAALITTMAGAHAAGNLVADGSFESQQQNAGTWNVYGSLPGWSVVSGTGVELRNNVAGTAFDGNNFVELDGYVNSAISQTLATDAGSFYTLSFEYSARASVSAASNPIEVLWNGASVATVTADGTRLSALDWHQFSYQVHGTGSDALQFRAVGISDGLGGSLDAVSVTAVPEPSTWVLMLAGFGLIGLSLGRRSAAR